MLIQEIKALAEANAELVNCPCCKRLLEAEEMADKADVGQKLVNALIDQYGSNTCHDCAEKHVTCYTTGAAILRKKAARDEGGEYFDTRELADDSNAEMAGWRDHCNAARSV